MNIQKSFPLITLLLAGLFAVNVHAADPNICYVIGDEETSNDDEDRLFSIHRTSGAAAVSLGDVIEGSTILEAVEAMTISLDGNTLYAVEERFQSGQPNNAIGVFGTVALDGTFTRLSPAIVGIGSGFGDQGTKGFNDVDGMAIDPRTGIFYGTVRTNSTDGSPEDILFQIDPATGSYVVDAYDHIASGYDYVTVDTSSLGLGINDIDDIAIDPTDGQMYGMANIGGGTNDRLVKINKLTGAVTDVARSWYDDNGNSSFDAGEGVNDVEGYSFFNDGTFYAVTGSTNTFTSYGAMPESLFVVNTTTAEMTHIAEIAPGVWEDFESVACLTAGFNIIGGKVFNDLEANGSFDGADTGTQNITVNLYIDENNDGLVDGGDTLIQTRDTDASGDYQFEVAFADDFVLEIDTGDLPAGSSMTTDNVEVANFTGFGNTDFGNDFGWVNDADLAIVKTVDDATPNEGDTILYTLTVTNNGPLDATGVTVNDTLPSGVTLVSVSSSQGGCTSIPCVLGGILSGNNATITITATVNSGLAETALLTNTATVSGNENDPISSNNTDTADIITCPVNHLYNIATVSSDFVDPTPSNNTSDICSEVIYELDISGVIYNDTDGDGDLADRLSQGGTETALAGPSITVTLYLDDGFGNPGAFVDSVVTTDGTYEFLDHLPNDYVIVTTTPAGYTSTNDISAPNDDKILVSLTNANVIEQDFLDSTIPQLAPVSGRVVDDADGDGDLSERGSEAGINGVTVELWIDSDGNGTPDSLYSTTTTAGNGDYSFSAVPPGDYVVVEIDPASYTSTNDVQGAPQDNWVAITRTGSVASTDNDFLDSTTPDLGSIGDTIFWDKDLSGTPDTGEGIANVTVWVDYNNDGNIDANEPSVITDGNGNYTIPNMPVGDHPVKVDATTLPAGFTNSVDPDAGTPDGKALVSLTTPGEDNTTTDFGYTGTGSIGDRIYNATTSAGIENVVVYIDENHNGLREPGEPSATTDASGIYTIDNLPAGTYDVKVDVSTLPTGLVNTVDPEGAIDNQATVNLAAGENNTTTDFGYEERASISGQVKDDAGNSALPNVKVVLKNSGGTIIDTVFTDADGNYSFDDLPDGTYTVVVDPDDNTLPFGAVNNSDPDAGAPDGEAEVTIINSVDVPNQDFGYLLPTDVTKSVVPTDTTAVNPGDSLTYTLVPTTSSTGLLDNVRMNDATPVGTTFLSASPGTLSQPSIGATGAVVWDLGSNSDPSDGSAPGVIECPRPAVTLTATQDATNKNDGTFENNADIKTKNTGAGLVDKVGLVQFDLSTIPAGATINSADLKLFLNTTKTQTDNVHQLLKSWTESSKTWTTDLPQSTTDYTAASLGSIDASVGGLKTVSIASLVDDWVNNSVANYGVVLVGTGTANGDVKYDSSEGDPVPELVIEYSEFVTDCAGTYTLPVSQDATNKDDGSLEDNADIKTKNTGAGLVEKVGLVQFDLSTIPVGATINSADLKLFLNTTKTQTDNVHQLLKSWTESSKTWTTDLPQSTTDYTAASLGSIDASVGGLKTVSITSLVNDWVNNSGTNPNYGVVLVGTGTANGDVKYDSSEGGTVPELVVDWTLPAGPGGDSSLAATPSLVKNGDTVTITMTVSSTGQLDDITPATPTVADIVGAANCTGITAGPAPPTDDIPPGGGNVSFTWTCTADVGNTTPASVAFDATATATDEYGNSSVFSTATANSVLMPVPLTFVVNVDNPSIVEQVDNQGTLSSDTILAAGVISNQVSNPIILSLDYGDLPDSGTGTGTGNYQTTLADDGPRHIIGGTFLGANATDAEADGQQNATATGDDIDGNDDEDGVVFSTLVQGGFASITVTSSGTGVLNGWADWNNDGVFDASERIYSDTSLSAGANVLALNVPPGANIGDTAFRFRVTDSTGEGGDSPTGLATTGEVEDYLIPVLQLSCDMTISGTVFYDYNQLLNGTVDGLHYIPPGINAVLVKVNDDDSEEVVEVTAVPSMNDPDPGQYSFTPVNCYEKYYVMLTTSTPVVGSTPPTDSSLPASYFSTGEHIGAGPGDDGLVDGKSSEFGPSAGDVMEVNFGIIRFVAITID